MSVYRSTVLRCVTVLMAVAAVAYGATSAIGSTPAESVKANFISGPFHITFTANRAADAPATAASGTFHATASAGSTSLLTLAGPVTCLDIVGHEIGLFYAVGSATPSAVYAVIHGVYIYVTDSSAGKPLYVNFVPSTSSTASSCAPIPAVVPITSGTAQIDPPTPAVPRTTLETSANSALGETIVVGSSGRTVYELGGESRRHLQCTKKNHCFSYWPPLTVHSAKTKLTAGAGINGKLGILHRNGIFQLTLSGHPLYYFVGDRSKPGSAAGQGIHSFGGRWHVVSTGPAAMTTTTTPAPPVYPGY
jgi:predicted lipoprotein with Yx(FWY)xxD motif